MEDTIPNPSALAKIELLPIRRKPSGAMNAIAENYVVSMELDVQLPPEYLDLSMEEKEKVRDGFLKQLVSDGKDEKSFKRTCLMWDRCPVSYDGNPGAGPLTLGQLREIVARNLTDYSRAVWGASGDDRRGKIVPPTLAQMATDPANHTQYVWRNGEFVCIHSLLLYEEQPQQRITRPWSFEYRLSTGRKIVSQNRAVVSWSIL